LKIERKRIKKKMCKKQDIVTYLSVLKQVYDDIKDLSALCIYKYISKLEKEYLSSVNLNQLDVLTYACSIHKNNINYLKDRESWNIEKRYKSLNSFMKCWNCNHFLTYEEAYKVHLLNERLMCKTCGKSINMESIQVNIFLHNLNRKDIKGKFSSFLEVYEYTSKKGGDVRNSIKENWMKMSFTSFDLVKSMFIHLKLVIKLGENFLYFSQDFIIDELIDRYNKSLNLSKTVTSIVPTLDIYIVLLTSNLFYNDYEKNKNILRMDDFHPSTIKSYYFYTFLSWNKLYSTAYSLHKPTIHHIVPDVVKLSAILIPLFWIPLLFESYHHFKYKNRQSIEVRENGIGMPIHLINHTFRKDQTLPTPGDLFLTIAMLDLNFSSHFGHIDNLDFGHMGDLDFGHF
jgi:hypothetical protein